MGETTQFRATEQTFADWVSAYTARVTGCLEGALPATSKTPHKLHEAMRYAVFSGGKRVRPLLVYASGECLGVTPEKLDALATAIGRVREVFS